MVKTTGSVDTNTPGTYKIIYSVTNNLGIKFTEERTVIVLGSDISIDYDKNITKGPLTINIGVVDNYFDYIIFPNNEKSTNRYSTYNIINNGKYNFKIYSKNGTYQEKSIEVNNIDSQKPTGTCSGYYKSGTSYITINASDNMSGIDRYVINNQSYQKNAIKIDKELEKATITIYDGVDNSNTISCNLKNNNPVVKPTPTPNPPSNSSIVLCNDNKIYKGKKYSLTQKQKEKIAAMLYNEDSYTYTGLKTVASHMCNLYEREKFYKPSISDFYSYMSTFKWYSAGSRAAKYDPTYMKDALKAVEEVIIGGNRTLPLYIDEFDWFPKDVVSAKNKDQYIQNETLYRNIYGSSKIVFWCFSLNSKGTSGNIYGYTQEYSRRYREYVMNNS